MSIGGGPIFGQSGAMLRYAGRLGDGALYPMDPASQLKVDIVLGLAGDFAKAWMPCLYMGMRPTVFGYPEDMDAAEKGALVERLRTGFVRNKLPELLGYYAKHLAEHGGDAFFCGARPTIADCFILPQLRAFQRGHIDYVPVTVLDKYPAITGWIKRMMAIPAVEAWYQKQAERKAAKEAAKAAAAQN